MASRKGSERSDLENRAPRYEVDPSVLNRVRREGSVDPDAQNRSDYVMDTLRDKLKKNRLGAVAALWATAVATSFAWNFSKPNVKTSVKLIHARLHAQAITLAALAAIALVEVYEHKTGEKSEKYKEHVQ